MKQKLIQLSSAIHDTVSELRSAIEKNVATDVLLQMLTELEQEAILPENNAISSEAGIAHKKKNSIDNRPVLWAYDVAQNRFTWSLDFYRQFHGIDRELVESFEGFLHCIIDSERISVQKEFENAIADKSNINIRTTLKLSNGSLRYIDIKGHREEGEKEVITGTLSDITNIYKIEKDYRASEKEFNAIISNIPAFIVKVNEEGRIEFINRTVNHEIPAEVLGATIWQFIAPEDQRKMKDALKKVFKENTVQVIEISADGERGTYSRYKSTIGPIAHDGEVTSAIIVSQDISSSVEIRKNLQQYAAIVENSSDAILSTDKEGIIQTWNHGAEELFGYTPDEAIGKPFTILSGQHPVEEEAKSFFSRVTKQRPIKNKEIVRYHKSGSKLNLSLSAFGLFEHGEFTGTSAIFRDISERKKTEKKLKETEQKWESLINNSNDIIAIVDSKLKVKSINKVPYHLGTKGLASPDIIGMDILSLVASSEKNKVKKILHQCLKKTTASSFYFTGAIHNTYFDCSVTTYTAGDTIDGLILQITDISEKVLAEIELQENYDTLQKIEVLNTEALRGAPIKYLAKTALKSIDHIAPFCLKQVYLSDGEEDVFHLVTQRIMYKKLKEIEAKTGTNIKEEIHTISPRSFGRGILNENQLLIIDGYQNIIEFFGNKGEESSRSLKAFRLLIQSLEVHRMCFIPLISDEKVFGMVIGGISQKARINDLEGKLSRISRQISIPLAKAITQRTLKENEKRYRHLFERNLAGVYRMSRDNIIIECNKAFAEIMGYENAEDLVGMRSAELFNDLGDQDVMRKLANEDVLRSYEHLISIKGGEQKWILENMSLITDEDGLPKYIEGTVIDITKQKQVQLELDEQRKQAVQYQSMLLSSQLNPHFIFNSLNSVQYYILNEQIEPALNYIADFSKLMRTVLQNSLHPYITLDDEIDFLKLYLELEKRRFSEKFEYRFETNDLDLQGVFIPPMLLQPYVENTVVHGIGNKAGMGHILIAFEELNGRIQCIIQDDGVGREKALELRELRTGGKHKSLAMNLTGTRFDLLNEIENDHFNILIEDLKKPDGSACGTRILIDIPKIRI